jgi:hypothetical protein
MQNAAWREVDSQGFAVEDTEVAPIYRAMLASAPPAPTPDAGSDLTPRQLATFLRQKRDEFSAVADRMPEGSLVRHMNIGMAAAYSDAACAAENLTTPPPAEDLAGQGEPVAWAWEYRDFQGTWHQHASAAKPDADRHRRNIRPLYAAPAPSRPADREEIARLVFIANNMTHDGTQESAAQDWTASIFPRDRAMAFAAADAILERLALRDASRTGEDGTQETTDDA